MSKKEETKGTPLFDDSETTQKAINNIDPFEEFIYDNLILQKDLIELTNIFKELSTKDRHQLMDRARQLQDEERRKQEYPSIYDDRQLEETAYDVICRKGLAPELYPRDGKIIEFLYENYKANGLLDGFWFTRATLRKLDAPAEQALQNWLRKNELPDDLPIPKKWGQAGKLIAELTPEQVRAAQSIGKSAHRYARSR